jgi:hypothetical protein
MQRNAYKAIIRNADGSTKSVATMVQISAQSEADAVRELEGIGLVVVMVERIEPSVAEDSRSARPAAPSPFDRRGIVIAVLMSVTMLLIGFILGRFQRGGYEMFTADLASRDRGADARRSDGLSDAERAAAMMIDAQKKAREQAELDAYQDRLDRNADAFMRDNAR